MSVSVVRNGAPLGSPNGKDDKLPPFGGRKSKKTPVEGLQFYHRWNADDFVGKYHKAKFANPYMATPGTTIVLEEARERKKKADVDRFEGDLAARVKMRANRQKVRNETTRLRVDLEMKTMLGVPMDTAENILAAKEEECRPKKQNPDTPHAIRKFRENCAQGNYAYISYALVNGFKSINAQDPVTGDTPLQLAVRRGDMDTIKELIKYCAEPNFRNNLGLSAQHEAWAFWKFHHNRTKEEREAQEQKTYDILYSMFKMGGFVDAQTSDGETALHMACRLGPIKVVLLCLAFKANPNIRTKVKVTPSGEEIGGLTPWDFAAMHGRHETCQLLECWNNIKHQTVLNDFIVVWRSFLKDYEAVITENKEAKKILFELNMDMSVAKVTREEERAKVKDAGIPIDDLLLRQTLKAKQESGNIKPKPWERKEWEEFKEACEDAGMLDHLSEEDQELKKIALESKALMEKMSGADERKKKEAEQKAKALEEMTPAQIANARLPSLNKKAPRPRTGGDSISASRLSGSGSPTNLSLGADKNDSGLQDSRLNKSSRATSPVQEGASTPVEVRGDEQSGRVARDEKAPTTSGFLDALDQGQKEWEMANAKEVKNYRSKHIRPNSAVGKRRKESADSVLMDATFLRYTRRPSTASSIMLSQRTPEAPLDGTEEEQSPLRYITDQGQEYELMAKQRGKNMRKALGFQTNRPPTTPMGDYNTGEILGKLKKRDALFHRLASKPLTEREAAEQYVKEQMTKKNKEASEAIVASEIDMVNGRSRFIESVAVPPVRKESAIRAIVENQKKADHAAKMKKLGLHGASGEAAMQDLQQQLMDEASGIENKPTEEQSLISESSSKHKAKKDALKRRMLMRSGKTDVKYGLNRVTSTHMSKGTIEAPWTTASGRYKVRAGDRTA